ncbi:MAG: hypothetical protein MZW92_74695 [Comamonadaceae bacterium]|nr:hypothetical protein [Comamonadaceae bacterium]
MTPLAENVDAVSGLGAAIMVGGVRRAEGWLASRPGADALAVGPRGRLARRADGRAAAERSEAPGAGSRRGCRRSDTRRAPAVPRGLHAPALSRATVPRAAQARARRGGSSRRGRRGSLFGEHLPQPLAAGRVQAHRVRRQAAGRRGS